MWDLDWVKVECCGIGDEEEDMDWPGEWEVVRVVGLGWCSSNWLCPGWWPAAPHSLYG